MKSQGKDFRQELELFVKSRIFLESRFLEVETPMLQSVSGGAAARPFEPILMHWTVTFPSYSS